MQQVEGSSPFSRFEKAPLRAPAGFSLYLSPISRRHRGLGITIGHQIGFTTPPRLGLPARARGPRPVNGRGATYTRGRRVRRPQSEPGRSRRQRRARTRSWHADRLEGEIPGRRSRACRRCECLVVAVDVIGQRAGDLIAPIARQRAQRVLARDCFKRSADLELLTGTASSGRGSCAAFLLQIENRLGKLGHGARRRHAVRLRGGVTRGGICHRLGA
jgi:hypothetical protein